MARSQSRKGVSLNREVYDILLREASRRGMSAAEFVTEALRKAGLDLPTTEHMEAGARARAVVARMEAKRRCLNGWVDRG